MAALREIIREYSGEIQDGIAWVAIWKQGRSWMAEAFWAEDGCYDDGYTFSSDDMERMEEILKADHKAIMINGYYTNCGAFEDEPASIANLMAGAEWNYYNRYNGLSGFYDSWVIK